VLRESARNAIFPLVTLLVAISAGNALGKVQPKAPPKPATKPQPLNPAVAAKVDGEPVLVREVERELRRALGKRPLDPQGDKFLRAKTLEQLIGQRVILRYLAGKKLAASKADIDHYLEQFKKDVLKPKNDTFADWLARNGVDEAEHRRTVAWKLSWRNYLEQQLTDDNLKKFFDKHPRDFDGSQVRAAHILFKVEPADDKTAREKALAQATRVREEIVAGKLTFAEAAKKYSAAPTAAEGGEIGFISRHEPMPEPFSQAAFNLEVDAVSEPVASPFGIHLITCLEVKPGTTTWQDARGVLEAAVTRYLFDWIVSQERASAKIEYTGAAPHFRPGTEEVE
jgi:parvulin-like peptidyl-prolyl isomerase